MTLLEKLDRIPPVAFRILAAKNGRALGPDEIAERSGLSRSTVQRTSSLKSWAGVRVEIAEAFVKGCGYRITHYKEPLRRLRVLRERGLSGMKHLNVGPHAPLWKRGANGNRMKFLIKIITDERAD